jgi:IclR family acetate operon transcriptional repressor
MHIDRLITILEMVAVAGRPIMAADICKATGLPRPTCYRLLQTLLEHRLIGDCEGSSRYVIGDRLIRIALLGKSDVDVRRVSAALLKSAAIKFGETVFLARFRNSAVEIIHVETPDDPNRDYVHPGMGQRPIHACSCSKAIAAFCDEEFQDEILNNTLKPYTAFTKTTKEALRAEFEQIVKLGYAECDQEIDLGVASVAAPITVGNIGATFSVGAVGPIRRFNKEYRKKLGQELIDISKKISGAIQLCNVAEI